jgi:hypothetical protein
MTCGGWTDISIWWRSDGAATLRAEPKEPGVNDNQRLGQAEQLLKEARAALRAAKGDGATVTPRSVDEAIEAIDIYFHYYFPDLTDRPRE